MVAGTTVVPRFNLQAGVVLSGTILGLSGAPEFNADLDVIDPVSGAEVETPADNTDAAGQFAVVVPLGTWDVRIQTAGASLSQDATLTAVSVTGPTTLNHTLSLVPVAAFVGPADQGPVAPGASVVASYAWFNPGATALNANVELILIDPAGGETSITGQVLLNVPAQQMFQLPNFAVTLPTVNPAHLGFPFRLELRFTDPVSGAEYDQDSTKFIIQ